MVCVFKGREINEPFHRQDFFFINYAWKNSYDALSAKYNNLITIGQDECYIGQPFSGYAPRGQSDHHRRADPEGNLLSGIPAHDLHGYQFISVLHRAENQQVLRRIHPSASPAQ